MNGGAAPQPPLRARLRRPHGAHALRLPDDSHHRQHLRRRAGVPRGRALALATAYVVGIAAMFGTLGTTFGLLGPGLRDLPGQPLGDRAAGAVLLRDGAVDVRRLRGRAAVGAAGAPGARRRARLLGAFRMGLVAGIIAAPCTGPPLASLLAYVATTRNASLGVPAAGDLRRRRGPAFLVAGRLLDVAAHARAAGWSG